jgi:hypothetical protein
MFRNCSASAFASALAILSPQQSRTNRAKRIRSWSSWDIHCNILRLVAFGVSSLYCNNGSATRSLFFSLFTSYVQCSPVQSMPTPTSTPVPPTPTAHGICKKHHHYTAYTAHTTPLTPHPTFPSLFFLFGGVSSFLCAFRAVVVLAVGLPLECVPFA